MDFGCSGLNHHRRRSLVGFAAGQAAIDRFDRREGDGNHFENSALRKGSDPGDAYASAKNYVVTSYFVTGCSERLSMM